MPRTPMPTKATPAPTPVVPPLPTWTDAASVQSYITAVAGLVVGFITTLHPGFSEPAVVQGVLGSLGFVIAGVAQIVNVVTHRSVQKAAIVAASYSTPS